MWMYLVLLYGVFKGLREVVKKQALKTSTPVEVLLVYSAVSFLMVIPEIGNAGGVPLKLMLFIALKSFIIFVAWILSFNVIKKLPISLYGVLDLSRVLFATLLAVVFLSEKLTFVHSCGLFLVALGLLSLKYNPLSIFKRKEQTIKKDESDSDNRSLTICVILAFISCLLNAVSGLMDKILTQSITSSQLQFWYMLYLVIFYILYAVISKEKIRLKQTLKNPWIWVLSALFVIADRALFIANESSESKITVMTLLKQAGCIVTILAGKFIYKEKNTTQKFVCAAIIIVGIILGAM